MAIIYHTTTQVETVADYYNMMRKLCWKKKPDYSCFSKSTRCFPPITLFSLSLLFWFYISWVSLINTQTEQFLSIHHFMVNNSRTQGSEMKNGVPKSRLLHGPMHTVITQSLTPHKHKTRWHTCTYMSLTGPSIAVVTHMCALNDMIRPLFYTDVLSLWFQCFWIFFDAVLL